jgi:hypothetical protein
MTKNYAFQQPLIQAPQGMAIKLYLHELPRREQLEADPPDQALIQSILENWLLEPIQICPDGEAFYVWNGRRRLLAIHILNEAGQSYQGMPIGEVSIPCILRDDLTPETAILQSFEINHLGTENPVSDLASLRAWIENLALDISTPDGLKQATKDLAKVMRTKPAVIAAKLKYLAVSEAVWKAFQEGRIAQQTVRAIVDLKDQQALAEIEQMLAGGEEITAGDVLAYKQSKRDEALQKLKTDQPVLIDNSQSMDFVQIFELFKQGRKAKDWKVIDKAIEAMDNLL